MRHGGTSGYLSLGAAFLTGTRTGILAELQGRKAFWDAASARTVGRGALSEQAEGLSNRHELFNRELALWPLRTPRAARSLF